MADVAKLTQFNFIWHNLAAIRGELGQMEK